MALIVIAAYAVTLIVFLPGVMSGDARSVYDDSLKGFYGDWQSPVMTLLWKLIDPIAPGVGSMVLLTATLYWLGFGLIAITAGLRAPRIGILAIALALTPPAILYVGTVWRDILFGTTWLAAAAIAYTAADQAPVWRKLSQATALGLLAVGVLLRPNALAAAPFLAAALLWPRNWSWRRTALLTLPASLLLFGLVQVVYYDLLHAERQHPLHSVMVFDLGGASHFAAQNLFPGIWTPEQSSLIANVCYHPTAWELYWTVPPCDFVMKSLEGAHIFGTAELTSAWWNAISTYPLAYFRHRAAFTAHFLVDPESSAVPTDALGPPISPGHALRLTAIRAVDHAEQDTPLLWGGTWLAVNIFLCALAWSRRNTPDGTFVLGTSGAAVVYTATFFAIGVATDFRYNYWSVLAALASITVSAAAHPNITASAVRILQLKTDALSPPQQRTRKDTRSRSRAHNMSFSKVDFSD